MALVVDTKTVDPRERFDFWVEGAVGVFYPMTFRRAAEDDAPFDGLVRQYLLGPLALTHVISQPTTITRTRTEISSHDPEAIQLCFLRHGTSVFSQRGQAAKLARGEFVLHDTSSPSLIRLEESIELIVLEAPKSLLGAEGQWAERNSAQTLPSALTRALVAPFMGALADGLALGEIHEDDSAVGESALNLMRAACREPGEGDRTRYDTTAFVRMASVKQFIDEHIGESSLGPETVAAAHFMSTRALQKMFQAEGLTVTDWIRERRLAGARRDLRDPLLVDVPIATIGATWGFPNPGHFSRIFRSSVGMTPRAYRRGLAA